MNNEKLQKGIENIRSVKLNETEKTEMLKNISVYMDELSKKVPRTPSPYFNVFSIYIRRQFVMVSVLLLFFGTIGGATVIASKESLPGDLLYPIKVNVTEPVVGVMTINKTSKIDWEVEKADRRLHEAETLVEQGRLDNQSRVRIEELFSGNINRIDELAIQENVGTDSVVASSTAETTRELEKINNTRDDFEKAVSKHTDNLEKMKERLSDDKKEEVESLKKTVLEKMREKRDRQDGDENKND